MGNWEHRHRLIPAIFIIFVKDNTILLAKRGTTGYKDGWYSVPAGHPEGGEPLAKAACREAKEEVGVDIKPQNLRLFHTMHELAEGHERLNLGFEVLEYSGNLKIMEPHKCTELRWVPLNQLPDKTVEQVRLLVSCYLAKKPYSEFNFG